MRIRFLLALLAVAGGAQAAGAGAADTPADGQPMAWRYGLLQTAQAEFDKNVAARAPGAVLAFRLPKVDPVQGDHQVELVQGEKRTPLPMLAGARFALPHDAQAASADAMVVANQRFPKGDFNHPNVQVRSPGLPQGVNRMGDLRLACAAQIAMGKAEGFKIRAIFAAAGLFGLDVCEKLEVTNIDAPNAAYDTVVIEDGDRKLAQSSKRENMTRLGDQGWSDNARISFLLNGVAVQ